MASGYICLSLGKCVKNQKCSPKYVRCHLIISVMIPPFPFLRPRRLWTSAEGIEIIKNRYSKALTQKDFPQSLPLSPWICWATEVEMSTQRNHMAQVKRSHFNSPKSYCSQFRFHLQQKMFISVFCFFFPPSRSNIWANAKFTVLLRLKIKWFPPKNSYIQKRFRPSFLISNKAKSKIVHAQKQSTRWGWDHFKAYHHADFFFFFFIHPKTQV